MTNHTQGLREAYARIIEPIAFAHLDDGNDMLGATERREALAKADAILALPSPRSREPNEADREMIEGLRALLEKATPRPWVYLPPVPYDGEDDDLEGAFSFVGGIEGSDGSPVCDFGTLAGSGTMFENVADHNLICDAVNALPRLLALAERNLSAPPLGGGDEDQDDIPGRAAMRGTTASHPEMSEVAGTAFIVMLRATDYDGSDWPLSVHWSEASAEARIQHLTEAQAAISKGQPELVMGADGLPTDASWAKLERWQKRAAAAYKTRTGEVIEPHEIGSHRWFIAPMPLFPETSEAADGVGRDPRPTGQLRDVPKSTPPTTQHGEG